MALFKIFNNANTKNDLPDNYKAGYCYFDVNTGKFYIDTIDDNKDGRIPISGEMADKLRTARTITLNGDVTGSTTFDGSGNVTITAEVAADSHEHNSQYLRRDGANHMTGNIDVVAGSEDKYLAFWSAFNNVSNWRIGYQGSGHAESNYFVLQSSKDTVDTWTDALKFGNRTLDATFAGKIIAPQGLQGNADTASKFKTAQTITVAGDATGTVTFDGSEAKTLSLDVGSADQLSSNYKINGTAFNGSKDITTASWGTARNVSITDGTNTGTATSMGAATSGSYSLKLPTTIKATLTGNASTATSLAKAVTIALAGDVSGSASFNGAGDITINAEVADDSHLHTKLKATGFGGNSSAAGLVPEAGGYAKFFYGFANSTPGSFPAYNYANTILAISRHNSANYNSQLGFSSNGSIYYRAENGTAFTDETEWKKLAFTSDNVASADKWSTERTLTLTGDTTGSVSIDGSSNMTMETTVLDDSHNHNYLGKTGYIAYPAGNTYSIDTSNNIGALKITIPTGWSSTMVKFTVSIYNYQTNTSVDYIIGGYIYKNSKTWMHQTALCLGKAGKGLSNLKVRFCNDEEKPCVTIGEVDTTWQYIKVSIHDITWGFSYNLSDLLKTWPIELVTTLPSNIQLTNENTHVGYGSTAASCYGNSATASAWKTARTITLTGGATGSVTFNGAEDRTLEVTVTNDSHHHSNATIDTLDASKITTGTISIDRLPQGALERLVVVADDTARFKLTTNNVQLGDVVKVTATDVMYFVKDTANLGNVNGYELFAAGRAASVNWANIQNVPTLSLTGDVTGSVNLAGIAENGKTIEVTVADDSHEHTRLTSGQTYLTDLTKAFAPNNTLRLYTRVSKDAPGLFSTSTNANAILAIARHDTSYNSQLGFSDNGSIYYRDFEAKSIDTTTAWKKLAFTSDNVESANRWSTERTLTLAGDVTGSISFDGSQNITLGTTVVDYSHKHTIANVDGLQNALNNRISNYETLINRTIFKGNAHTIYLPEIHNGFAAADKRWIVTGSYTGVSSGTYSEAELAILFNGSYESRLVIPKGTTATITINFGNNYQPEFPYGDYLLFYYTSNHVKTASKAIVYCDWNAQGIGEKELTATTLNNEGYNSGTIIEKITNSYYNIKYCKFIITAPADIDVYLTQIHFIPNRGNSNSLPYLSKYYAETLYYPLTVPSVTANTFIGDLNGNAATATQLTSSAGNAQKPVYFSNGKPVIVNHIHMGASDSNTYSDIGVFRKSDKDTSHGKFVLTVDSTGAYGVLTYAHTDTAGTQKNTSLLFNNDALKPSINNTINLGTSNYKWSKVYATTFEGNATSADKWSSARTLSLTGDVTGSASVDGSGDISLSTTVLDDSHAHNYIGKNRYIAYPSSSTYYVSGTSTGALKITLPVKWTNNMIKFTVSIYNYVTGTSVDYIINGYNYTSGLWYHPTAVCLGKAGASLSNLKVRYCTDGTYPCITIGEVDTTWQYITVSIHDITWGNASNYADLVKSWGITTVTTLPTVQHIVENTHVGYNAIASSCLGNSATASKWATARTLTIAGDATGSVSIDGSANKTLTLDVATAAKTDYALTVNVTNVSGTLTTTTFNGSAAKTININASDFMPLTSFTKTLTLTTSWQDVGISSNNIANSGSYIIQILVNDGGTTGTLSNYSEYYTGVMSWYASNTNSTDTDEIILHKAGHASNSRYIYLRTVRTSAGTLKMQIAANVTATAASTLVIKVRQLI